MNCQGDGRRPMWPLHCVLLLALLMPALSPAKPERPLKDPARPTGILVLDDCDEQYQGKQEYRDNLTLLDSTGKQAFRISGFNNCESIGSSRMVAVDQARKCIWVIENVARRIRRFDLTGKQTLSIEAVHGSALSVDPQTGNVWALVGPQIGKHKTVVYDIHGKMIATYDVSGWDIVYDRSAKAFWIAERNLTKIAAASGEVFFSKQISTWCASSVDVDRESGAVWVAVREHPQIAGSSNRLLKFDAAGKEIVAIDLGRNNPFRVSVDPKDGSVWVAQFRRSVDRFSRNGQREADYAIAALAVQADPTGGDVWVVTQSEILKMNRKGEFTMRATHAGTTSQAWIASLE